MDGASSYQDWANARENAREAIADVEREGEAKAVAEAMYYEAKALCVARLKAENVAATNIGNMVKGDEQVNARLYEFRSAEAKYKAACLAAQLFTNEEAHCYDQHKRVMTAELGR